MRSRRCPSDRSVILAFLSQIRNYNESCDEVSFLECKEPMHLRFNDTWTLLSDMVLTLYIGNEQLSWTSLEM